MDSMDTSTQPIEASPAATNVATFTPHRHSLPANQNMAVNSQTFSVRPRTHNRRISDYSIHTQPPAAFANQRSALSPHQIRQPRLRMLPTQYEDTASQDTTPPNTCTTGFRKIEDGTAQIPKRSTSPHHVTVLFIFYSKHHV